LVHAPSGEKGFVNWRGLSLVEHTTPTPWLPLAVREAKAASGAKLAVEAEHAVFVSGENPPQFDSYSVSADSSLPAITALRLEALPDARLQNGGPGRGGAAGGNFVLGDFRVTAAPRDKPDESKSIALASVAVDFVQDQYSAAAAIDADPKTGWAVYPQLNRPHVAVFTLREDLAFPAGARLNVTLSFNAYPQAALGRFRLSATNVARPVPAELPGVVLPLLTEDKAGRFPQGIDWFVRRGSSAPRVKFGSP
jgi:hypothetical protein